MTRPDAPQVRDPLKVPSDEERRSQARKASEYPAGDIPAGSSSEDHPPDMERRDRKTPHERDEALDDALEDSFPASDPASPAIAPQPPVKPDRSR